MNIPYDLAVAYRINPVMSRSRPPIFADDKLKLAEFCLASFKQSLGGLRVKLWALLNNCPPAYEEMFARVWEPEDLVLVRFPGVPAGRTLCEQSRILARQTDAEIVYFAEDDYFYLPGQFRQAVDFLKAMPEADFATPYDHLDVHTTDLHRHARVVKEFAGRKWLSVLSTTHTFLAKRTALLETQHLFERLLSAYSTGTIPDLALWMALTKTRVFNPVKFVQWLPRHPYWSGSIALAWWHCWRQIVGGRRYTLWSPTPSIATHMVAGLEAPGVDWPAAFAKTQ
jgi:hypothetical protein